MINFTVHAADPRLSQYQHRRHYNTWASGNSLMWRYTTATAAHTRTYKWAPLQGSAEVPVVSPDIQRVVNNTSGYLHNPGVAENGYDLMKNVCNNPRNPEYPVIHHPGTVSSLVNTPAQMNTRMATFPVDAQNGATWKHNHYMRGICTQQDVGQLIGSAWQTAVGLDYIVANTPAACDLYLLPYMTGQIRTVINIPQHNVGRRSTVQPGSLNERFHEVFQTALDYDFYPTLPTVHEPSAAQGVAALQKMMMTTRLQGQVPVWRYNGFVMPVAERERFDPATAVKHCGLVIGMNMVDPGSHTQRSKLTLFQLDPWRMCLAAKKKGLFAVTTHLAHTFDVEVVHKIYGMQGNTNDCYHHMLASLWELMVNGRRPSFTECYQTIPVGKAAQHGTHVRVVGPDWYRQ